MSVYLEIIDLASASESSPKTSSVSSEGSTASSTSSAETSSAEAPSAASSATSSPAHWGSGSLFSCFERQEPLNREAVVGVNEDFEAR